MAAFTVLQRVKAATTTTATSLTATLPGAATTGSKLIALITTTSGSSGITMPGGWTQRATNTAQTPNCFIYDHTTTSTSDNSVVLTLPSGGAVIYLIEADGVIAFDTSAVTGGAGPSASLATGTVTPTTANSYLLSFVAHTTNATDTFSAPVTLVDQHTLAGAATSFHSAYADSPITGTTGRSATITPSASVSGWETILAAWQTNATSSAVSVNLSGSGTLSATGVPRGTVSASLSGSGTLSATATPKLTASPSLTGSGALTATVIHVAAAALSGSGTLTADFGALNVNANLTGSGTLTASVPSIVVNPTLTGSGALTVSVSIPNYAVALSGSGQLTAAVTPKLTATCALGGTGLLVTSTSYRLFTWMFRTPTQEVWFHIAGRGLVGKYDQGLSVYRVDGSWRTRLSPGPDELATADRYFQGGYLHRLDDAQRAELIAGGFADNITYEEVTA